jgi:4-amino-4-deoxy-L-arabinose transferase-like glycosyltransferase
MKQKYQIIILIAILAVAGFFRLWQIGSVPGGLFPDEAANGQDALLILDGYHSPFFEHGLGREGLFFYLLAGSIYLFGIGVWQIHLVSAIIGILTVLAAYLLTKALFSQRVALLAGFFLATSYWHVTLSRTGFRAILVPLFSTLFFYFAYLVMKENNLKKRFLWAALAGINFGLGFYTYISFRAVIGIIGLMAIFILLTRKRFVFEKFCREIGLCLLFALLVLAPLLFYFYAHPEAFVGRAGCVSIFNPDLNQGNLLGTFLEVFQKTMLMFFTEGDLNWRHNVSGFPMLNPLIAALLAFGILLSLITTLRALCHSRPSWDGNLLLKFTLKNETTKENILSENFFKHLFLFIWFFGMLAPELMTAEAIPHGLRAIGVLPVVFIWPALSVDLFWKKAKNYLNAKTVFLAIVFALLLSPVLPYDYNMYFGISANSPEFYYAYRSDLTEVSKYLNQRNLKEKTYLVLDEYSVQTPDFLTAGNSQPYILLNPEKSFEIGLSAGEQIVFTQSTIFDSKKYEEYHPEVEIVQRRFNRFGEEVMKVYEY